MCNLELHYHNPHKAGSVPVYSSNVKRRILLNWYDALSECFHNFYILGGRLLHNEIMLSKIGSNHFEAVCLRTKVAMTTKSQDFRAAL